MAPCADARQMSSAPHGSRYTGLRLQLDPGQVGVGGQCSDCHAGQNSFVVHPRKAPFKAAYTAVQDPAIKAHGANLNGDTWYKPLGVDPSWPQNPNPGNNRSEEH